MTLQSPAAHTHPSGHHADRPRSAARPTWPAQAWAPCTPLVQVLVPALARLSTLLPQGQAPANPACEACGWGPRSTAVVAWPAQVSACCPAWQGGRRQRGDTREGWQLVQLGLCYLDRGHPKLGASSRGRSAAWGPAACRRSGCFNLWAPHRHRRGCRQGWAERPGRWAAQVSWVCLIS